MSISSPHNQFSRRKSQAGLTLLEVIVSLGIISTSMIGMNMIASRYSDDTKVTIAASQTRTFGEAAKAYIKDNYAAIQAVATPTSPALIDVPTLIASGHLLPGFLSKNAFGQDICALVLEPTANRMQAMVVAEGGTAIDDLSLGNLAAVVGGSGGGVYSTDATVIRGAVGGWSITTATFDGLVNNVSRKCDGTAGNVAIAAGTPAMALWFENGDSSSAFLARDAVPGRPELNAMNTPIVMNSVQVANDACSNLGAIARSSTGAVLSCQSGLWKSQGSSFWEDPVATFAALPTCDAAVAWQTRVVQTPTVGTGPRAYTCTGTVWSALAVNDSGNITIAGIATAGKVLLTDTVTVGTACSPNGLVSKDSTGQILSCQSGLWNDGVVKSYIEFPYVSLSSCSVPGTCRIYVDNFTTTASSFLLSTGTHQSAGPYGSSWVQISVNGAICAIDRSIDTAGYHPYSSATCLKRLPAGTHQVITYFVGDNASSVADAFGARALL